MLMCVSVCVYVCVCKFGGNTHRFNSNPAKIEKVEGGLKVTFEDGSTQETDVIMYATGRVSYPSTPCDALPRHERALDHEISCNHLRDAWPHILSGAVT